MKKYYWVIYITLLALIVVSILVFPDMSDMGQMVLYGTAIILTSIFLYSSRSKQ